MPAQLLALGADGDRHGWVVAAQDAGGATRLRAFADVRALWAWRTQEPGGARAPVLIDVPIGLAAETGLRACDAQAAARLGPRRSSVFQPPGRHLLAAYDPALSGREVYARVRDLVAARRAESDDPAQVKGLSAQAAGILPKICELDAFLREDAARNDVLAECHPEVSFTVMNGGVPLAAKSSAGGQLARLDLVRAAFPDAEEVIRTSPLGGRHGLVDILDAYAALWSALRWRAGDARDARRRDARSRHRRSAADDRVTRGAPITIRAARTRTRQGAATRRRTTLPRAWPTRLWRGARAR